MAESSQVREYLYYSESEQSWSLMLDGGVSKQEFDAVTKTPHSSMDIKPNTSPPLSSPTLSFSFSVTGLINAIINYILCSILERPGAQIGPL